jgi:two-component system, OmpR family, alkaline phosphatase synthesis response regulator PhoP
MEDKKIIYAVDDEKSIREVYSYALKSAGFEIECFSCFSELASAIDKRIPDLILLDIMLDGEDGYDILKMLRNNSKTEDTPIMMVSAKNEEIDKVKGLDLGADDYISKPFGIMELIARINSKFRKSKAKNNILSYKDIYVDDTKHEIKVKDEVLNLTLKQYELLRLLVINAEKVMLRDELLDKVWGENYGETRTLDIHIGNLRKFIENSSAEIATIRGVGYTLK